MKILFLIVLSLFSYVSLADELFREVNCNNLGSCIEVEALTAFEVRKDASFEVSILENTESINNLKIYLWMIMPNGHEHGTAPLKITEIDQNKFKCEKALFVMKGSWQIRVEYIKNGIEQKFIIPLVIQ